MNHYRLRLAANFAPAIGVAVTYAVYRFYFIHAHINGFGARTTLPDLSQKTGLEADVDKLAGFLSWGVTGAVFMLVFAGGVAVLLTILKATLTESPDKPVVPFIVGLFVALSGVVLLGAGDNPFAVDTLNPFIVSTLELSNLQMGVHLLNAFTPMMLAVTVLMVFSSISTLMLSDSEASSAKTLRRQLQYMNTVLFTGAILLVVGVVHANSVHHLPDAFLSESDLEVWKTLITSLSASTGAVWTLILIGFYLPSVAVLRLRAQAVAKKAVTNNKAGTTSEWFESHGLTVQFPQRLAQFAALISPFLVGGPASPLLGLLGG